MRSLVQDGCPLHRIVASDLRQGKRPKRYIVPTADEMVNTSILGPRSQALQFHTSIIPGEIYRSGYLQRPRYWFWIICTEYPRTCCSAIRNWPIRTTQGSGLSNTCIASLSSLHGGAAGGTRTPPWRTGVAETRFYDLWASHWQVRSRRYR